MIARKTKVDLEKHKLNVGLKLAAIMHERVKNNVPVTVPIVFVKEEEKQDE